MLSFENTVTATLPDLVEAMFFQSQFNTVKG